MSERLCVGIEIGGTKLQLGIGSGQGELRALERLAVDPSRGAGGILDQIRLGFASLLAKSGIERDQIEAVGIGFGGPVNGRDGRTQKSFQVTGWDDFPLAAWVTDHLGVPRVVLENDSDTAGLAEARFGAGIGHSPLLYMNIGSGIGGALIIDQQIYRGFGQGATEIGHLRVPEGTGSQVGLVELEQVASGWAIARYAQDLARRQPHECDAEWIVLANANNRPELITAPIVAQSALAGDPRANEIFDRARSAVAFALSQAITLLAPSRIVLGGGVSLVGDALWFEPIRRSTNQLAFEPFRGQFDIVPAGLGEEVVVHGAVAVARDVALAASSLGTYRVR